MRWVADKPGRGVRGNSYRASKRWRNPEFVENVHAKKQ